MLFKSIPNLKGFLAKLKNCCSAISKFALNSPCLLQFIRYNGELEIIISHDATNGNAFDFYKIFENLTYDEFSIPEEDVRYFEYDDKAISSPIVVSSIELDKENIDDFHKLKYDIARQTFFIFPKFILEALKAEYITDVETNEEFNVSMSNIGHFDINFKLNSGLDRFNYKTFIPTEPRILSILNLEVLPLGARYNNCSSTFIDLYTKNASAYIKIDSEMWDKLMDRYKNDSHLVLEGQNCHKFFIYHNDFFQKKIVSCYVVKEYEHPDNIVTLRFKVVMKNCVEYFKYKYYEI